jgi:sulfur-carrier protein
VHISLDGSVTQRGVLDALEGTIRDHTSKLRRPFIRFFACEQDLSHMPPDDPLPSDVIEGKEAFLIIGAIAGG